MNNINNNYNKYNTQNASFKAEGIAAPQGQEVRIPDMYYMPDRFEKPATLVDTIKKVDMMGMVSPWFENPLAMLGLCLGMSVGIDAIEKTFNKEYEKSSLGRAAKLGDKIHNWGFVQSKPVQSVIGGIKSGWKAVSDFALKNSVIRAMVKTPSKPNFKMPKSEMETVEQKVLDKFQEVVGISRLNGTVDGLADHPWSLEDIAATKAEKAELKRFFNVNKLSEVEETKLVNGLTLKRLGKTEAEINSILNGAEPTKNVIREVLRKGNITEAEMQHALSSKDSAAINTAKKFSENLKELRFSKGNRILSKIPGVSKLFSNTTGFGEVHNKLHSMLDSSKTGSALSKFLQQTYRGFTFGNGKLGVMFWVAPFLYQGIKNTIQADKSEKVGTFAKGLIDSVSWVFVFPIVLKGIHALGGIQYAGMTEAQVNLERKLISDFNELAQKTENGGFLGNKTLYKEELAKLKDKLKANRAVKDQSLLVRSLRTISRFTKADLNKIMPYQSGNQFADFMRKLPKWNGRYGFLYSFARFAVFMFVGMPLVDKVIEKITSKIFGRSRDEFKEQEYEDAKKAQEEYTIKDMKERMLDIQRQKMMPEQAAQISTELMPINQAQPAIEQKTESAVPPAAVAEMAEQTEKIQQTSETPVQLHQPQPVQVRPQQTVQKRDNYTYIPSQDSVFKNDTNGNPAVAVNKYIPSQTPAQFTKTFDNSALEAAMRRAARAEQRALQTLAGNFGNSQ